eukprot:gene4650-5809_t
MDKHPHHTSMPSLSTAANNNNNGHSKHQGTSLATVPNMMTSSTSTEHLDLEVPITSCSAPSSNHFQKSFSLSSSPTLKSDDLFNSMDNNNNNIGNTNTFTTSTGSNGSGVSTTTSTNSFRLSPDQEYYYNSKIPIYSIATLSQPTRKTPPPNLMNMLKTGGYIPSHSSSPSSPRSRSSSSAQKDQHHHHNQQQSQQPQPQPQQQPTLLRSYSVTNFKNENRDEILDVNYISNRFLRSRSEIVLPSWETMAYEGDFSRTIHDTLVRTLSNSKIASMINKSASDEELDRKTTGGDVPPLTASTNGVNTPLGRSSSSVNFKQQISSGIALHQLQIQQQLNSNQKQSTDDEASKDKDLIVNEHGDIVAGSVDRIIGLLTDITKFTGTQYVEEFLFTYHYFIKPPQLLEKLIDRFDNPLAQFKNPIPDEKEKEQVQAHVRLRVINVLKKWVEGHGHEFTDPNLYKPFNQFLDRIIEFNPKWGGHIKRSISGFLVRYLNSSNTRESSKSMRELVSMENLETIAMLLSKSLHLKERKKKLRTIKNSFLGEEAVDWLKNRFDLDDREKAKEVLSKLLKFGYIKHHSDKSIETSSSINNCCTINNSNENVNEPCNNNQNNQNNNSPPSISSSSSSSSSLSITATLNKRFSKSSSSLHLDYHSHNNQNNNNQNNNLINNSNHSSSSSKTTEFKDKSTTIYYIPKIENEQDTFPEPIVPKTLVSNNPYLSNSITFLDIHPVEIARQLTLIEFNLYCKISSQDLYHQAWNKPESKDRVPNIMALITRSNTVSYWVATEILLSTNIKHRATVLKRFITIAEILRQLNNWNTLMGIMLGLNLGSIQRLKKTWESLPKNMLELFQTLTNITNERQNYANYRKAMSSNTYPCLPFMAVYLKDLTFTEENPDFLENGFINFDKMKMIAKVLIEIHRFQSVPYHLKRVEPVEHLLKTSLVLTDKDLYKASNLCEPTTRTLTMNSAQEKLIYFPDTTNFLNPSSYGFEDNFDEITLKTKDGIKLQAWFFKQQDSKKVPTMLFCHSNAGNLSHRLDNIRSLYKIVKCNVFILSYRGYGKSQGIPSENGLKFDIDASIDWLLEQPTIDPNRIFCFGRSLGGAVAIDAASRYPDILKALILENTFSSIPEMVDVILPQLKFFKPLCRNKWNSIETIKSVTCPILFLSAKNDELVPRVHMENLEKQSIKSKFKQTIVFENGYHMTLMIQQNYYRYINEFLLLFFVNNISGTYIDEDVIQEVIGANENETSSLSHPLFFDPSFFGLDIIFRGDPRFNSTFINYNIRISRYPFCFIRPRNDREVQLALLFAKSIGKRVSMKSGGHSCEVFSVVDDYVALDFVNMNKVTVDPVSRTAVAQPGVKLGDFYNATLSHGLLTATGGCPTVNVGGLTLAGGSNYLSPKYGYAVDNVLEVKVLLSSGRVVIANNTTNTDLFWALRGAGHGGFGILLSTKLQLHPQEPLYYTNFITFPYETVVENFKTIMDWSATMDKLIYFNLEIMKTYKNDSIEPSLPRVRASFFYNGNDQVGETIFRELVNITKDGVVATYDRRRTYSQMVAAGYIEPVHRTYTKVRMAPQTTSSSNLEAVKSLFEVPKVPTLQNMSVPEIGASVYVNIFYHGGNFANVPTNATALFIREYQWSLTVMASYNESANDQVFGAWKDKVSPVLDLFSPYCYPNYPDAEIPNWQTSYFGTNLPRLQRIKRKYDPFNYFNHYQSITPAPWFE